MPRLRISTAVGLSQGPLTTRRRRLTAQDRRGNASYKRQKRNPRVTEIKKMPERGHSLTIDHGWQEVAQTALDFVKRFVQAKPS